jgi:hypothetical protein
VTEYDITSEIYAKSFNTILIVVGTASPNPSRGVQGTRQVKVKSSYIQETIGWPVVTNSGEEGGTSKSHFILTASNGTWCFASIVFSSNEQKTE